MRRHINYRPKRCQICGVEYLPTSGAQKYCHACIIDCFGKSREPKRCPWCGQVLPITDFAHDRSRKDGRNVYCRACCHKAYMIKKRARAKTWARR